MKIQNISTLRIVLDDDYYCDVIPSIDADGTHDFYLRERGTDNSTFMFAVAIESAEQAAILAESNADHYKEITDDN